MQLPPVGVKRSSCCAEQPRRPRAPGRDDAGNGWLHHPAAAQGRCGLAPIPVIVVSGVDEIESVVRCIELGAADYLPKPFNPTFAASSDRRLPGEEASSLIAKRGTLRRWAEFQPHAGAARGGQVTLVERLGRLERFFSPQLAELVSQPQADDPLKTHRREVTVCSSTCAA